MARREKLPTVYILSNAYRTVLYTGVTGFPYDRIPMHKEGRGGTFASRFRAFDLIYYELHATMREAIRREKQIKRWKREWKLELIRSVNPELRDLSDAFMPLNMARWKRLMSRSDVGDPGSRQKAARPG